MDSIDSIPKNLLQVSIKGEISSPRLITIVSLQFVYLFNWDSHRLPRFIPFEWLILRLLFHVFDLFKFHSFTYGL